MKNLETQKSFFDLFRKKIEKQFKKRQHILKFTSYLENVNIVFIGNVYFIVYFYYTLTKNIILFIRYI